MELLKKIETELEKEDAWKPVFRRLAKELYKEDVDKLLKKKMDYSTRLILNLAKNKKLMKKYLKADNKDEYLDYMIDVYDNIPTKEPKINKVKNPTSFTKKECKQWIETGVNPKSNRKLSSTGKLYQILVKECGEPKVNPDKTSKKKSSRKISPKNIKTCKKILKSGKRKGEKCGAKTKEGSYCGRHCD